MFSETQAGGRNYMSLTVQRFQIRDLWRYLGPDDDRYARAIYLGQGCWDDLTTITEEEGDRILREWGYSEEEYIK
jgi:hypothetical protein